MKKALEVFLSLFKGDKKGKLLDILRTIAKYGGIVYSLIKIVNFAIEELQDDLPVDQKKLKS